MTLLENTYKTLNEQNVVHSREHFSEHFLKRNKNWYSYQTHKNRDFSLPTAVKFVGAVTEMLSKTDIDDASKRALLHSKHSITYYLENSHNVFVVT
jgi:hypothetical protein